MLFVVFAAFLGSPKQVFRWHLACFVKCCRRTSWEEVLLEIWSSSFWRPQSHKVGHQLSKGFQTGTLFLKLSTVYRSSSDLSYLAKTPRPHEFRMSHVTSARTRGIFDQRHGPQQSRSWSNQRRHHDGGLGAGYRHMVARCGGDTCPWTVATRFCVLHDWEKGDPKVVSWFC